MAPRYFVYYLSFFGQEVQTTRATLGRFDRSEAAGELAAQRYAVAPCEVVGLCKETPAEAFGYRIARVLIRSLRIAFAVAIGLALYAWLSSTPNIADIRFADLTLNLVFSALWRIAIAILGVFACWALAFGDRPDIDQ